MANTTRPIWAKGLMLCAGAAVLALVVVHVVRQESPSGDSETRIGVTATAGADGLVAKWDIAGGEARVKKGCSIVEDAERGKCLNIQTAEARAVFASPVPLPEVGSTARAYSLEIWMKPERDVLSDAEVALAKLAGRRATKFASAMHDGKWHHIVVTFDPERKEKEYALFLDWFDEKSPWRFMSYYPREKDVASSYLPVAFGRDSLTFGGEVGWAAYSVVFRGLIDDVAVYDRCLSPECADKVK